MARPRALSAAQKKQLVAQIRRGADLPALVAYAKKHEIAVSRTILGELMKATRDAADPSPPAPTAPPDPVAELRQEVAELRQRLVQLEAAGVPRLSLLEAATQAVQVATRMSQDPEVDPGVRIKALAVQPDLIDSARRLRESEEDDNEESGGGLFSAGAPAAGRA